jgi:hypothetical protein
MVLYQEAEITRRDGREVVGFSRNQFGEYDASSRRTAMEAQIVQQGSASRLNRRQNAIRDAYVTIGEMFLKLVQQNWTQPRVTQVLDPEGVMRFVTYTGSELRGDYDFNVGFSYGTDETLQSRRMQALQLYGMMANDPSVDRVNLVNYLIKAFNDPDFSNIFRQEIKNADISMAVQSMQQNMGAVQQENGNGNEMPPV